MKIGITASAYSKFPFEERYKIMKSHGFSCADFSMADTLSDLYNVSETEFEKNLLHEKELSEEAGIEISQVHGPWRWPPQDTTEAERAERIEKMKKSIRGTAVLGCKNWVIHPIMPFGIEDIGTDNAVKTWDMNLTFMSELLVTAKEYGIIINLENMPMTRFSLATPSDILRFVREINDNSFKICLDTGHVSVFPELSPANAVRELGSEIHTLHVHDNRGRTDEHLMPYSGIINWEDFGRALNDIGFDGAFSFETSPSSRLPLPIFAEMCRLYCQLGKTISENH